MHLAGVLDVQQWTLTMIYTVLHASCEWVHSMGLLHGAVT